MKRVFRIGGISVGVLLVACGVFYLYADSHFKTELAKTYAVPDFSISSEVSTANLALGERIVRLRSGCAECHGADLSGKAIIDDPVIGKVYSSNLTPFALAGKTDEALALAIRHGLRPNGTSLIFMPSYEYQNFSKSDLAAIIAYLRSVPSVEKRNTPIEIGPVGKMVYAIGKFPVLTPASMINHKSGFVAKPKEAANIEFGKYLVNSACTGCHGPELMGGPVIGGAPDWPPAANLRFKGRDNWTQKSFFKTMQTGTSAQTGQYLRLPMAALVGRLNEKELTAIWLYLSSLEQLET
jgi:mono/diheme cytochrome c family protein